MNAARRIIAERTPADSPHQHQHQHPPVCIGS
jgi:hypothetical protein